MSRLTVDHVDQMDQQFTTIGFTRAQTCMAGEHRKIRSIWSTWSNGGEAGQNYKLAHHYAAAGYPVLPVSPTSKRPTIEGGFKSASTECDQIDAWWRKTPAALPGLATGLLWVLDIDHPTDGSQEAIAAILAPMGLARAVWSAGLIVRTPRGGAHLYFGNTPGVAVPPRTSDIADKIDTRWHDADGTAKSYIIAPGAVRPDGTGYEVALGALDEIGQAPHALLYFAHFNRRERALIKAAPALQTAIRDAGPDCWRALFADHQAAELQMRWATLPVRTVNDDGPLRLQALADLQEQADLLASTIDGRKAQAFKAACAVGRYVAYGVLAETEVIAALMSAWTDCGAGRKHGARYGLDQIKGGIKIAARDALPPVAKRFRVPSASQAVRTAGATSHGRSA